MAMNSCELHKFHLVCVELTMAKVKTSQIDAALTARQCCQPEDEDKQANLVIIDLQRKSAKVSLPMII